MPEVVFLRPDELRAKREKLLAASSVSEADLRERARDYLVTPDERALLEDLDELDYLLGA